VSVVNWLDFEVSTRRSDDTNYIEFPDPGCGCCSASNVVYTVDEAVERLTDFIAERQTQIDRALKLRDRIENDKAIPSEEP